MKWIHILLFLGLSLNVFGQETDISGDDFIVTLKLSHTSIKNQDRSATCWSFAGISFLESELLRTKEKAYDLSEMFVVKHAFMDKVRRYVRMHGHMKFTSGGAFNDVINVLKRDGMVPQAVYSGNQLQGEQHRHGEMNEVLKNYAEAVITNENNQLTSVWDDGYEAILDAYLGPIPSSFTFHQNAYTPKSFAQKLELNPEHYIWLTSFSHHPFYQKFVLEVPDNWSSGRYYNVPLPNLIRIMDQALNNGYTLTWAGDVSESYFSWQQGVAELPSDFDTEINQESRQIAFDNYETTDDHGMHVIGRAKDQDDKKFYLIKNSWGTDNSYSGYMYLSKKYVMYKTTSIMVHKNAVPAKIAKKLGLENK